MRFRLREALRPLELLRLLSLGATLSESLSTRLDSVRAPDLLCDSPRVREPAPERAFAEDDRFFDFDEELLEPPERLLLLLFRDREDRWGILPSLLLS